MQCRLYQAAGKCVCVCGSVGGGGGGGANVPFRNKHWGANILLQNKHWEANFYPQNKHWGANVSTRNKLCGGCGGGGGGMCVGVQVAFSTTGGQMSVSTFFQCPGGQMSGDNQLYMTPTQLRVNTVKCSSWDFLIAKFEPAECKTILCWL